MTIICLTYDRLTLPQLGWMHLSYRRARTSPVVGYSLSVIIHELFSDLQSFMLITNNGYVVDTQFFPVCNRNNQANMRNLAAYN